MLPPGVPCPERECLHPLHLSAIPYLAGHVSKALEGPQIWLPACPPHGVDGQLRGAGVEAPARRFNLAGHGPRPCTLNACTADMQAAPGAGSGARLQKIDERHAWYRR